MNSIVLKKGSIFTTKHQTIVNTVNCVGVMGAGLALECRFRYPEMFIKYKKLCNEKVFNIGQLFLYKSDTRWILNFPTKLHWKYDSKIEYLEKSFKKLIASYHSKQIESIAFPMLGSQNGGLGKDQSLSITMKYAEMMDIPVEIYEYDSKASDDIFPFFKQNFLDKTESELVQAVGIKQNKVEIIKELIQTGRVKNMIQISEVKGVGESTIQKCYDFAMKGRNNKEIQLSLF